MYRKLNDFLLGYKEVKQVNHLKCKEMGHVINDALDDEGGEGTGEDASAIQRLVLIASLGLLSRLFYFTIRDRPCHVTVLCQVERRV